MTFTPSTTLTPLPPHCLPPRETTTRWRVSGRMSLTRFFPAIVLQTSRRSSPLIRWVESYLMYNLFHNCFVRKIKIKNSYCNSFVCNRLIDWLWHHNSSVYGPDCLFVNVSFTISSLSYGLCDFSKFFFIDSFWFIFPFIDLSWFFFRSNISLCCLYFINNTVQNFVETVQKVLTYKVFLSRKFIFFLWNNISLLRISKF